MSEQEIHTEQHKVGTCPACRCPLLGEVDMAVVVGRPYLSNEGKANVHAHVEFQGMRVQHHCERGDGGEWITFAHGTPARSADESASGEA